MSEIQKPIVEVIQAENDVITVRVNLSAPNRTIERHLIRTLKPFKICPKNPKVKEGVNLMLKNPVLSAGEASRIVCNSTRLERQIRYWSDKLISFVALPTVGGAQ